MIDQQKLLAAVKRFKNADIEYGRAQRAGAQPRLNKAGTRYYVAKVLMFRAAGLRPRA